MSHISVIVDGIDPSDIYQGRLGDCYFLSSVSALAERQDRISRLLITKEPNEKRVYSVALNVCGVWERVDLDDFIPTSNRRIVFCHSASAELWAILLEKAYAKVNGGYWNIGTGGFAEEALKDLTGAPTEYDLFDEDTDEKEVWEKIQYCDKESYIMVCGSRGSDERRTEFGIIQGHAYTIINAHLIRGEKVLEMRNPWGDENEWNGRWSDSSNEWSESLRRQYKMVDSAPDGRFFMPYDQFLRYFDQLSVCYYEDKYILSSFKQKKKSEYLCCYHFKATVADNYYVSVSQPDSRKFHLMDDKSGKQFNQYSQ